MSTLGYNNATSYDAYWNRIMTLVENQGLNITDAEWARPQTKFTYEMLELQEKVTAMATYVSISSEPLAVGAQAPLEKLTGSIPRQRVLVRRTEEDYRNQLNDLNDVMSVADLRNINSTVAVRSYLEGYLFDTQAPIADGHRNSLNYAVGQAKCKGKVTLNDKNNPRGLKGVTFDLHVPEDNFIDVTFFYQDSVNGELTANTDVYPIKVIAQKLLELKWKYYSGFKLRMDDEYAYHLVHHPNVLTELGYIINPALRLNGGSKIDSQAAAVAGGATFEALKEAFRIAVGADEIEYYNTVCGVDILDTVNKVYKTERLKAFDFGVISVSPLGTIISLKNVAPLRPDSSAITADIFGGHGIVEYRYDAKTRTQEWISELTVLPVLTRPKDMYYYNTVQIDKTGQTVSSGQYN
jgi:hypothetical protein